MTENELSNKIIGCAIEVHKQLGPGLLESAYQECLFYELIQSGLKVEKEKPMPMQSLDGSKNRKRGNNIIFIEEPEANLHPEVQVKIIEVFSKLHKNNPRNKEK